MMMVENPMVVDSFWPLEREENRAGPEEFRAKINGPGYRGVGPEEGIFVAEEDAFEYALERISFDKDAKKELVEWFYSGNWIKEG